MPSIRVVLFAVATSACGGTPVPGFAYTAPPATPLAFRLREEPVVDPRASTLMQWVHPLLGPSGLDCSSTAISDHVLLTAAHCVDGGQPPSVQLDGQHIEFSTSGLRACAHGDCAREFPTGDFASFKYDLATVAVPVALPSVIDALAHVRGYVPGAFMLSARTGTALAICGAHSGDEGEVHGEIELSDSGSSIVAFTSDGRPVVIGVVSHRRPSEGRWYFAPVSEPLPWPAASDAVAPTVGHFVTNDLSTIEDCP